MFSNNDVGDYDSSTTPTSEISVKEIELKELDALSLDIGLLTNTKSSSTVSLLF